jgi:hypothetical protein
MLIVFFVLLENSVQFLLLYHQFVEKRVTTDEVATLELGIAMEVLVLPSYLPYFRLQLTRLSHQLIQIVGF